MTTRRSFLRSAVSALLVGFVDIKLPRLDGFGLPVLHGDGIHDDTAAIQALVDGGDVWSEPHGRVLTSHEGIVGGHYRVTSIRINPESRGRIVGASITSDGGTMFRWEDAGVRVGAP